MNENEVAKVRTKEKGYKYSSTDFKVHSEISEIAQEVSGDSAIIETFFFLSNEKELGIFLFGPKDPRIAEKMTCGILEKKYKNTIPPTLYILYYDEDAEGSLISAVKTK